MLDELVPASTSRRDLIAFVTDRPGHDARYAMDISKIKHDLDWHPQESFETALRKTVAWYLENSQWWGGIRSGRYSAERLGLMSDPATA